LAISHDGREAVLKAHHVPVLESFQFGGQSVVPATASFEIEWKATGPSVSRGSGSSVAPTDAAAFSGSFRPARATGWFSGSESGFTFRSRPGASTDRSFAEIGTERNGSFMR
jgi:hypothetical protein